MGSPNGGIVGVVNPTSFGKCTQTIATASTPAFTTQPGTRIAKTLIVAGGGGGGRCVGGGGGAGGLRIVCVSVLRIHTAWYYFVSRIDPSN
jgi:hypothetical protein